VIMDRAQAHTLEGIIASLLVLTALLVALQTTSVTPLTASTSSQHIENQHTETARGVLAAAAESGALRTAILYWDETDSSFHNTGGAAYYPNRPPDNISFGRTLNRSFDQQNVAYNVYFQYDDTDGTGEKQFIYRGQPSDNAISVSRTVVVTDENRLYGADGTPTNTTVGNASGFYAPDAGGAVYNTVEVRVVVWRL
jgi:hypothetical protein